VNRLAKRKKQILNYLEHKSPDRVNLHSTLESIITKLPETAIFGGMLRDFALGEARAFSSDIDLVSLSNADEISEAIAKYCPERNKFGGYRFTVDKWRFDIWAFEDTWAFREGLVKGAEISDLFKTTFFNLDASLFHLGQKEFLCDQMYIDGVNNRILEINLAENPSPLGMVRRAMRLVVQNNLSIGLKLANYILEHSESVKSEWVNESLLRDLKLHVVSNDKFPYEFKPQLEMLSGLSCAK